MYIFNLFFTFQARHDIQQMQLDKSTLEAAILKEREQHKEVGDLSLVIYFIKLEKFPQLYSIMFTNLYFY